LQKWGQNFDDMPSLPLEDNPGGVGEGRNQGAVTGTSEPWVAVILLGVSVGELGLLFVDYVPLPVAWGTWSTEKRAQVDGSFVSTCLVRRVPIL
jgi:hypothetical protein